MKRGPNPNRCRMALAALVLAAAFVPLPAGRASAQAAGDETALATRAFIIRYKEVDDVYLLISPYLGTRGSIQAQPSRKTLTVIDAPENLDRISDLIRGYDLPPRTVEVAVQLIMAQAGPGAGTAAPAPPPIRGVIEKLNALSTRWNDYRLVGNAKILGTEGERSSLQVGEDYRIHFKIEQVSEESRVIRFKPFELQRRDLAVEGNERYSPVLHTVLNLKDSQQFIVGASRMERSNRALFMSITASLQGP